MTRNRAGAGNAPTALNAPDRPTFYSGGARGYVGYLTLAGAGTGAA